MAGIDGAICRVHCQSVFSLLDGASTPESLLAVATKLGLHALALTDFSDMGGVVRFAESAKGYSIIPIIGNQISVTLGGYQGRIVLLAQNARGYSNLSRLVTASRVNSPRVFPIIDAELLSEHTEGLFCSQVVQRTSLSSDACTR